VSWLPSSRFQRSAFCRPSTWARSPRNSNNRSRCQRIDPFQIFPAELPPLPCRVFSGLRRLEAVDQAINPTIKGHDLCNGLGNDNDYDAESGDGIIFQGSGIQLTNEMAGFDWAIHNWDSRAADSEMSGSIFTNQQINILRDRFDLVEGLSGWKLNDKLTGRDVVIGGYDHRPI
jgi:hypothetical protein